jgi:hypothetical protein
VKDVPSFLKTRITRQSVTDSTAVWAANYKKQYIDTGSFEPMKHLMVGTFCLAYTVAWPQEYKHYMHEQVRARAAQQACTTSRQSPSLYRRPLSRPSPLARRR